MENWLLTKSWKSWVQEYCNRQHVKPVWNTTEEYPGMQPPSFRTQLTIPRENCILFAEASAKSKKEAEQEAARILICVKMSNETRNSLNPSGKGKMDVKMNLTDPDPISVIKMMCEQRKIGQAIYEDIKTEGQPHNQTFYASCNITSLGVKTEGMGKSKKDAKKAAAFQAVEKLKRQGYLETIKGKTTTSSKLVNDMKNLRVSGAQSNDQSNGYSVMSSENYLSSERTREKF